MNKYLLVFAYLTIFSCVPQKKYDDLQSKYYSLKSKNILLKDAHDKLLEIKVIQEQILAEKNKLDEDYKLLLQKQKDLDGSYNLLIDEYDKLSSEKTLTQKEKDDLELMLKEKEISLSKTRTELGEKELLIEEKARKIDELQSLLKEQKQILSRIKNDINNALSGFEGKGITVEEKNGRIYVSMESKLLFQSASWKVEPTAVSALKKIATVLNLQSDVTIVIEGHTDDKAYSGNATIEDNWDLSVKRATSITKILQANGVKPEYLLAAGKSKYAPLQSNETESGRSANRRVEIILSPSLQKINSILEQL